MYELVLARTSFIFTMLEKGCPQKNIPFLIFLNSSDTTMTRFRIIRVFSKPELQLLTCLSVLRASTALTLCKAMVVINALNFD